ncbi:hypothetical protein [Deinococcus maricopensis]|uniref:DUF2442 domain-containing protein n=1 Tax=Deinococcus maricopensis (strain DSM 21211 / LMG 22137 / NRRL B-23946 / LB-34) TaxID=709986 RepID=E8UBC1_DEIML|nr:hypothetical protein [Deinococcus maricopensis]ADV68360.1 hypothetical protein Deima_2730 [Deinococcus maricopensis DSM 21211]
MTDPARRATLLVVDAIDADAHLAEVELEDGFTTELPLHWLPGARPGAAYRATPTGNGVQFEPLPGGAQALRERSKQTLLDFSDEHDGDA